MRALQVAHRDALSIHTARRHIDDARGRGEFGDQQIRQQKVSEKVRRKRGFDALSRLGASRQQDSGVVDENVNRGFDSLGERAYVGHQTKVCDLNPDGSAASLLGDARCDLFRLVSIAPDELYSRAEARQLRRGLLSQAGCRSRDHGRPACEVRIDARVRPPAVAKRRIPEQRLVQDPITHPHYLGPVASIRNRGADASFVPPTSDCLRVERRMDFRQERSSIVGVELCAHRVKKHACELGLSRMSRCAWALSTWPSVVGPKARASRIRIGMRL
jgi:hypothetical protein